MSKKTKIWLFSGLGALAVLAIVLAIWQPWKKEEPKEPEGPGQVVDQDETKPEEKGLVLKVGNEEIPAVRYTGDGWSILVPETWKRETVEESAIFTQDSQRGGPQVLVSPGSGYFGTFMSLAPEEGENGPGLVRRFYTGSMTGSWEVSCRAPAEDWDQTEKLLTAVARSFTLGQTEPFAKLYPLVVEPDWQNDEGHTALFLDKNGYLVEEGADDAVRDHMLAWSDEMKKAFSGQYRLEDLTWVGSYTGIGEGYIDIFAAPVWYEAAEGADLTGVAAKDWIQQDGWAKDGEQLTVAVCHDGSEVAEKLTLWISDAVPGGTGLAGQLAENLNINMDVPLTAEELKGIQDWCNDQENNGLLRFPLTAEADPVEALGPNLGWLFYDLGDREDTLTAEEKEALQAAGVSLETDVFRRTRTYVTEYLTEKLGLTAEQTEALLAASGDTLGTYLEKYDAWYAVHGDTEMQTYTFDGGTMAPDGTVTISYTAPYLHTQGEDGGAFDVAMTLVLRSTGRGGWQVVSNEPAGTIA